MAHKKKTILDEMMEEVHRDMPSTVPAWVKRDPKKREAMLRAIAFSKARAAGAKV